MDSDDADVVVLGVDPADRRTLAALVHAIPDDASALAVAPGLDRRRVVGPGGWRYPPGVLLALARTVRGGPRHRSELRSTLESVAADRDRSLADLDVASVPGDTGRSGWWTVGTWATIATAVLAPLAGLALYVLRGGLLVASFGVLLAVAAVGLLAGLHHAHAAEVIRRADAAIAVAVAAELAPDDAATGGRGGSAVLVAHERNAPGVAAALRERGVAARHRPVAAVA